MGNWTIIYKKPIIIIFNFSSIIGIPINQFIVLNYGFIPNGKLTKRIRIWWLSRKKPASKQINLRSVSSILLKVVIDNTDWLEWT